MPRGIGENTGKDLKTRLPVRQAPRGDGVCVLKCGKRTPSSAAAKNAQLLAIWPLEPRTPAAATVQSLGHPDGIFKSSDSMELPPSKTSPRRACTHSSTPPARTKRGPGFPHVHKRPASELEVWRQADRQTDRPTD